VIIKMNDFAGNILQHTF